MQKNHYPLTGEQAIDKHPLTIRASLPVTEALAAMIQAQASCALVVEQQQLVGIFTERDAVKFTAEEMVWEGVSIASVMTQELITLPVTEVSDIFSLVGLLREHRIRHLPIVAEGGQVVGLVTPKTIRNALTPSDLLRHRQVAEVMRTEVIYAPPAVSIVQVAQLMTAHRVSCVVIASEEGLEPSERAPIPIGVITERDIVQYRLMRLDLARTQAQSVMSTPLLPVQPQDSLAHAHEQMKRNRVRRLIVCGAQGELAGVITQSCILQTLEPAEIYSVVQILQQEVHKIQDEKVALLRERNRELEQFAYIASHDLQEPLRGVKFFTHLLTEQYQSRLDAKADEYIAFIGDGVTRMHQLIESLLAYSRLGRQGVEFEPTDCNQLLEGVLTNLPTALSDSGADLTRDSLPTVRGDLVQLGQLFQNLIANAIKFRRPEVPPVIKISVEPRDGEWLFGVHDNGIGIKPEYFEQIFEIFKRLHSSSEFPGTGIGLAICQKIVKHHGGRIWVESQLGVGTTFYFTIPFG